MTKKNDYENDFQDDVEGNGMAMSQLYAISDKAMQLAEMLSTKSVGLEAWQQAKVTTASDEIGAVFDAVKYRGKTEKFEKSQKTFGGVERSDLDDSDFVFSEERKFPIKTPRDVQDAVSSWGRYASGAHNQRTFEEFKDRLIELVNRKGARFIAALPESWKEDMAGAKKMSNATFFKFATFEKASPEQRIVVGYASSERVDGQNDIVDPDALNQALGDYMQWANLREMHQPKAVGKVLSATPIRGTIQLKDGTKLSNPLRIICQIIDNETWEKVKSGVLKGFSIGGKVLQASTNKMNGKEVRRITGLQLHEISLVDRPANPDARIVLMKRDDSADTVTSDDTLLKASMTDPSKILPQLQQLRNQAEMDGDLEQAERYNEVISLMLEAMGVIPRGTTRDVGEVETGEAENANPIMAGNKFNPQPQMPDTGAANPGVPQGMPQDMMSMDQVYAYNPAFQQTSNVAYAQMATDLQKAGRMLSSATEAQLDQIMQAVQFITQQIMALKQGNQRPPQAPQGAPAMPGMPGGMPGMPGMPDMSAVPPDQVPVQAESPNPQVQSQIVPQQPPSSLAPSPDTMSMLRGIGNPVLAASQQTGDLKKGDVDIASIEKEISEMENVTENSAPPMEAMAGDSAPVTPTSINVDAITKSLTSLIAEQLGALNKQMEQMETTAKEQHSSIFNTVNPLTEAVNNTKAMVEPLMEKVSALEPLVEKVDNLAQRIEAIENTPVGNTPVLRGTAVSKALGGESAEQSTGRQMSELETLYKMLDETTDPIVRTKLREQVAFAEAKNIFRR